MSRLTQDDKVGMDMWFYFTMSGIGWIYYYQLNTGIASTDIGFLGRLLCRSSLVHDSSYFFQSYNH